jgi:hypothetical protein
MGGELIIIMPQRPRACAHRPPMMFLGAHGSAVIAADMSAQRDCIGACVAQALAVRLPQLIDVWCHVERACSACAEDAVVTGLARRGVREHRRDAGEPRHECSAMYMYTIESVPFN